MKGKVCVVTGSRSDYGLLKNLMRELHNGINYELQTVVTGMHLSPEFGLTYKQILEDGFSINAKVEMLVSSDSSVGVSKSIGLGVIGMADALDNLEPDLLVLLGDRFEIFSAASVAMIKGIPVAHLHGGEVTEGAFDESIRHAITKMSHLHFTSTEEYRNRVIQLGENPDNVFNVGAIGLDAINNNKLLDKEEFEEIIGIKLKKYNYLVTFHPVTLESGGSQEQFSSLLEVLRCQKETAVIFTKSNADTEGRKINEMIDAFANENPELCVAHTSLGQLKYLSAVKFMTAVIGNSSSGVIEVPSFNVATINIGDRQKGRIKPRSVVDCEPNAGSIQNAINHVKSKSFQNELVNIINPYGDGKTTENIMSIVNEIELDGILKKKFYDLSYFV